MFKVWGALSSLFNINININITINNALLYNLNITLKLVTLVFLV